MKKKMGEISISTAVPIGTNIFITQFQEAASKRKRREEEEKKLAERRAAQKKREEEEFTRIKELTDEEAQQLQEKLDKF